MPLYPGAPSIFFPATASGRGWSTVSVRPTQVLVAGSGPAGRGQVSHFREIPARHAGQYGEQIVFDGYAQAAAGFHDRENRGDFGTGLRAAYVQPVLAAQSHRTHGVLGQIV